MSQVLFTPLSMNEAHCKTSFCVCQSLSGGGRAGRGSEWPGVWWPVASGPCQPGYACWTTASRQHVALTGHPKDGTWASQVVELIPHRRANRQYIAMSDDELWRFLDEQRLMTVAFATDSYPHLTPVWYVVAEHALFFRASSNKAKAKLADGALVSCSVEGGDAFTELRGAMIRGAAEHVSDPVMIERYHRLKAEKYAGLSSDYLDMPESWRVERAREQPVIIRITPHRMSSWDNRKLLAHQPEAHRPNPA